MTNRQKARRLARRQQHVSGQNVKRREALDNAVVTTGLHSDTTMIEEMGKQGYEAVFPKGRGRWQRKRKLRVKQPRKDKM
jgi:hypothetical protein